MLRKPLFFILLFISFGRFSSAQLYAQDEICYTKKPHAEHVASQEKTLYFTLRFGQGGFP